MDLALGIVGLLGFLISLYNLWVYIRSRSLVFKLEQAVIYPKVSEISTCFLEFIIINQSELPFSVHRVDLDLAGELIPAETRSRYHMTKGQKNQETIIQMSAVLPIRLEAYESRCMSLLLPRRTTIAQFLHLNEADSQDQPNASAPLYPLPLKLRFYTSRGEKQVKATFDLGSFEEWLKRLSREAGSAQ